MPSAPAAPTVAQGRRYYGATADGVHADLKPLLLGDKIWKYWVDRFPTVSAVMKVRSRAVTAPIWYHFEQQPTPRYATLATAETSTSTAFGFVTGQYKRFTAGELWMNLRTWDTVLVTTAPTSETTVTVDRGTGSTAGGWGSVPAAAGLAGDRYMRVGFADLEGSKAPAAKGTLAVKSTFYAQDFRESIEMTSRLRATRFLVEPDLLKRLRSEKLYQRKMDLTTTYFWGGAHVDQTTTGERTTSIGLADHIKTNTWNVNGALSWGDLSTHIAGDVAPWNPSKVLVMMTSAHVKNIINNWAMEKVQAPPKVKEWGLDIESLTIIGGRTVAIIEEPFFNESPEMQKMAFIGSISLSAWRGFDQDLPYGGKASMARTTKIIPNILRDDNPTAYKEELFTSGGYEFWAERAWSMLWNIKW